MKTLEKYTKIGIWGYGVVGQSALRFFLQQHPEKKIHIYDSQKIHLNAEYSKLSSLTCYAPENLQKFLDESECILASPGIDLRPYATYKDKWVTEIDLFCMYWKKPLITITGTVGKTSITHLISTLLQAVGLKVATGGNIGTGMLDLLAAQDSSDYAVLELSSFQLEHSTNCAPTHAIITNIYENHLDRHGTLTEYITAKLRMLALLPAYGTALVPASLYRYIEHHYPTYIPRCRFFADTPTPEVPLDYVLTATGVENAHHTQLCAFTELPKLSYQQNWLIIAALFDCLHLNLMQAIKNAHLDLPDHRLHLITQVHATSFYDDSKATIIQATIAAVTALQSKKILLILGGVSKGVDRSPLLAQLHGKVTYIACFGTEAHQLATTCALANIPTHAYTTLEDIFAQHDFTAYTAVLFSPGGASFDLFKDYKERGKRFAELVMQYKAAQEQHIHEQADQQSTHL